MIIDTHVHTEVSADSEMKLRDALECAKKMNIGLIVTEHIDLYFPGKESFAFDVADYFTAYGPYRSDYCLLGVEVGMQPFCAEENRVIVEKYPFDYVLGSVHLVDGEDIYYPSYYENRTKEASFTKYLKIVAECLAAYPFIDALGHIDYISRYAPYADPELRFEEFPELLDVVLKQAIENGTILEINTRRFSDRAVTDVLKPIYQRYTALGGTLVTLGSDAHRTTAIGGNFALGREFAEACGLRLAYFKDRKPEYM